MFWGEAGVQKLNFLCVFETLVKIPGLNLFCGLLKNSETF